MTAHVMSESAGGGLGRMLVQGLAKDLTRPGIKAIEAFGDNKWTGQPLRRARRFSLSVASRPFVRISATRGFGWN